MQMLGNNIDRDAGVKYIDYSRLYSTAIRQASDTWGMRPCCARLCRVGNEVSQAEHGYPFNLDGSRTDDLVETCENTYKGEGSTPRERKEVARNAHYHSRSDMRSTSASEAKSTTHLERQARQDGGKF